MLCSSLTHCCFKVTASTSGQLGSSLVCADSAEIPVIPPTLDTVDWLKEEGVELGSRRGEGEGLCCLLGGRRLDGGLTRFLVRLDNGSELSTDWIGEK